MSSRFGVAKSEFWVSGHIPCLHVHLRLRGGKGGFGRAMRQEGERRSKRLPPHKDACRTLSGKRIGTLKAKRRVQHLREQIKELEKKRSEIKALKRKSNIAHELEEIEQTQHELGRDVNDAVAAGIARTEPSEPRQESKVARDDDFAILYEEA